MALPWYGWEGLRTVGIGVGLLGALLLASAPQSRRIAWGALALGLAAIALIVWRLVSVPANPVLREIRAPDGLALGLAGAAILSVTALWTARGRTTGLQRLNPDQRTALKVAWRAMWASRLLVWVAGVLGALTLPRAVRSGPGISHPFGHLGTLLTAPASAWDAGNYLLIAQGGYGSYAPLKAFFPLYPTLIRGFAWSPQAALVIGILISLAAFLSALYLLHRLMALETGREEAGMLVLVVAFFPMALFFSAVYTESLFLALSVGAVYAARRGWWARAGIAGLLASATRITGVLLILPLAVMYLYGPREDRPALPKGRRPPGGGRLPGGGRHRYTVERNFAYIGLALGGTLAYLIYMGAHGGVLGPLHAEQRYWYRRFLPGAGAVRGFLDAITSVRQILGGPESHVLARVSFGPLTDPMKLASANLIDFSFLVFACVAVIGTLRRLPLAYGIYALAVILVTVSSFPPHEPLESFPRFLMTTFPCFMWLALWMSRRGRALVVLALSAGMLGYFAAQFASWRWVA